jgi:hypothetical protein
MDQDADLLSLGLLASRAVSEKQHRKKGDELELEVWQPEPVGEVGGIAEHEPFRKLEKVPFIPG